MKCQMAPFREIISHPYTILTGLLICNLSKKKNQNVLFPVSKRNI